jgi:NADH:ubiquinone oxidoreductase subunit 2 (subunit N)
MIEFVDVEIINITVVLLVVALIIPILELANIRSSYIKFLAIAAIIADIIYILSFTEAYSSYKAVSFFDRSLQAVAVFDTISYIFTIAVLFGLLISVLAMPSDSRYYSFISIAIMGSVGTILLASSIDPVMIIASWTLLSVASFSVVALVRDRASLDAALRYSVVGSVATQILLIGIILATLVIAGVGLKYIDLNSFTAVLISLAAVFVLSRHKQ